MAIQILNNHVLSYVFIIINQTGDDKSVGRCERVCKTWQQTVINSCGTSNLRREINLIKKRITLYPELESQFKTQIEFVKNNQALNSAQKTVQIDDLNNKILLTMVDKKIAETKKLLDDLKMREPFAERINHKMQLVLNNQFLTPKEKVSLIEYYFQQVGNEIADSDSNEDDQEGFTVLQQKGFDVVPIDFKKNIHAFVINYDQQPFGDLLDISSTEEGVLATNFLWSKLCSALLTRMKNLNIEKLAQSIMDNESLMAKTKFFGLLGICLRNTAAMKKVPLEEINIKAYLDSFKLSNFNFVIILLENFEI